MTKPKVGLLPSNEFKNQHNAFSFSSPNLSENIPSILTSINADRSLVTVSTLSDLDNRPPPFPKFEGIRKASLQAQQHCTNQLQLKKHHSNAYKQATA